MDRRFAQATSISELTRADFLSGLLGETRSVEGESMTTVGFSGTRFERLRIALADGSRTTLVLKQIHPAEDVTAWRTGGVAREARLLAQRALDDVWEAFDPPYIAYACEVGVSAVLMRDLSAHLFPDVREPITRAGEDALLESLATLHATFWNRDLRAIPWIAKGEFIYGFLAPGEVVQEESRGHTHRLFAAVKEGWRLAHEQLPPTVSTLLASPPVELARITDGLPRTVIHGDTKVA